MSDLDAIRARAEAYAMHGTPGLRAPQDRAYLLGLIDRMGRNEKEQIIADILSYYEVGDGAVEGIASRIVDALEGWPA